MWWGIANNITDPLVRVFKAVFGELTTFQASLIQFAFYGGYFCMAIPGAVISRRFSYKTGVLVGLGLYAVGCFLLYPSTLLQQFVFFCLSYYVLACGLGILETNANPYILAIGPQETALKYHTGALILFGASRWVFTGLMKRFKAHTLLLVAAILAGLLTLSVIFIGGHVGVYSLLGISAFMSLMFPTIFGLGCEGLGDEQTKVGASGLIMAILGGALITPLQGALIDRFGVNISYGLPFICFVVIGAYAMYNRRWEAGKLA